MSKATKTKQFIVEQTATLFNRKGFAGTSMKDITAATGLTKGAVYGHFENKEALALSAIEYNICQLVTQLKNDTDGQSTATEKLYSLLHFYEKYYDTMAMNGGCTLMNAAVDLDDTQPELFQKIKGHFRTWRRDLEQIINEGIENNEIVCTVSAAACADFLIALIEGSILLSKTFADKSPLQNNLNILRTYIQSFLLVRP